MTRAFAVVLLLAGTAAAAPETAPAVERRYSLEELGLLREVRRDAAAGSVTLSLPTRADVVLTTARLTMIFDPRPADPLLGGIDVLINEEQVGAFDATQLSDAGREHSLDIDPAFLGDRNTLTLRFKRALAPGECEGRVPAGTWGVIARGRVDLGGTPLRLANDLALLPMPFADTSLGGDAAVPIAFLSAPGATHVRAAALVASWFGERAGGKLRFPVTLDALPTVNAVVFVDGAEAAAQLGLDAPAGPWLQMLDLPGGPKVLVVGGRDADEMAVAARALAAGKVKLTGEKTAVSALGAEPPAGPYQSPRWMGSQERILLARIPNAGRMELLGAGGGTIRLEMRLPPDLYFWQEQKPTLELAWSATIPAGGRAPRVTVEMNGQFVGTVPVSRSERGQAWGRARVPVSGDRLPGYNEILIHVDYGKVSCAQAAVPARFTLDPESALRLGANYTHFATYPNMPLFVDDGFPFTRVADLSETAAVIAAQPAAHEIETLLSAIAHFAAVTGRTGTGLMVVGPDDLASAAKRDLLVVGAADNHALLERWGAALPLVFEHGRPFAQIPQRTNLQVLLSWLTGRNAGAEASRAEEITSQDPGLAAAMAIQSPLSPGRAAVILTAATDTRMPLLRDLQGTAESSSHEADLLVSSRGTLWMFRLGASYDVGRLDAWRRFLRFLSQHWVALFPFVLLGTSGLALILRAALRERVRVRMSQIEETGGVVIEDRP